MNVFSLAPAAARLGCLFALCAAVPLSHAQTATRSTARAQPATQAASPGTARTGLPAPGGLPSTLAQPGGLTSQFPAGLPSPTPSPGGLTSQFPAGLPSPIPSPAGLPAQTVTGLPSTGIPPGNFPVDGGYVPQTQVMGAIGAGGVSGPRQSTGFGSGPYTPVQVAGSFLGADANRDGELTRAEAQRLSIMPSSFEEMDRNFDGVISRFEYDDGVR